MRIRRLISTFLVLIASFFVIANVSVGAQTVLDPVCQDTPTATVCKDNKVPQTITNNSIYGPNGVLTKAAKILSFVVGVVSIFVIVIAGVTMMLSTGDTSRINTARSAILYASIGLVVASLAQIIIAFVLSRLVR